MADYLLDTSFLIDLMKGEGNAKRLHEKTKGEQSTSTVCVYELAKFEDFDGSYLANKSVLPFSSEDADRAGDVFRRLRRDGEPIGETDSMIAGTAISRDLTLITRDTDFEKVTGLTTRFY